VPKPIIYCSNQLTQQRFTTSDEVGSGNESGNGSGDEVGSGNETMKFQVQFTFFLTRNCNFEFPFFGIINCKFFGVLIVCMVPVLIDIMSLTVLNNVSVSLKT